MALFFFYIVILKPLHFRRTVTNYMLWLFIKSLVPEISQRFRDVELRYDKVLKGTSVPTARWRECVESINDAMKFATGRMYVAETFSGASKENVSLSYFHEYTL